MFQELTPILSKRSLVLTLTSLAESGMIRVTVTPRSLGKDDPKALSTPFVVEGTAEELDKDLPAALIEYVGEHMTLDRALASVKATMDAELQVAKDEAAKKVAEAKKGSGVKVLPKTTVEPKKEEAKKPELQPTLSLFGGAEAAAVAEPAPAPVPALPPAPAAKQQTLSSIAGDTENEEELLLGENEDGIEDDEAAA